MTNNISECTNNWGYKIWSQPILQMFENLRRKCMNLIRKRFEFAKTIAARIPSNVNKRLKDNMI